MKKHIFSMLLLWLPALLAAQDILFLKDGRWIEAKVLEIQPEVVKYKLFDFQDGPLYTVYKSEVRKIQYENGRVEWFVPQEERAVAPPPETVPPPAKEPAPVVRPEAPKPPPAEPVPERQPSVSPEPAPPPIAEPAFHSQLFIGITAGINAATGIYDYRGATEPPAFSILAAPTLGASLDWRISPRFSLQSGLFYRGKGDRIDIGEWISSIESGLSNEGFASSYTEAEGHIQTYVGYLECPIYPVLNLSAGFQLGAGPYLAIGLHGKEKSKYKTSYFVEGNLLGREEVNDSRKIQFADVIALEDNSTTRYFRRIDYGVVGYLGIRTRKMTVAWTVSYGLQQWEPELKLFASQKAPTETRHLSGAMLLTYYFEL
ncbi:MAG: outer membrane beta-barrel protein [Phaeodactylibacter sp.]|nr:outer membrane beta-barrel protein [Phaeodactylibacter sp.]MCB9051491.1 outer membrane beta-barrel protein [Lewinellaceae bacterium]